MNKALLKGATYEAKTLLPIGANSLLYEYPYNNKKKRAFKVINE